MDTNEPNQTLTDVQIVKKEALEQQQQQHTSCDEDRLTVSQFLLSRQNPLDSSPIKVKEEEVEEQYTSSYTWVDKEDQLTVVDPERPCSAKKRTPLLVKKRGPKKRMVSDFSSRSQSGKRKSNIEGNFSDHLKAPYSRVIKRAEEVRARLSTEFPSFIKFMLRSHVTNGFWLGLPSKFCKLHLPRHDYTVVLESESGDEYKTNFLVDKGGLSGGWRAFSMAQKLLEGDVVVFHLVRPCKFKVYIVRANDLAVVNGAPSLSFFDPGATKGTDFEKNSGMCEKAEEKHSRLVSPNILRENIEENNTVIVRVKRPCRVDHYKRWKTSGEQRTKHQEDQSAQPLEQQPTSRVDHCKRWKRSAKQRTKYKLDQSSQSVEQQPTSEKNATTPEDESEEESDNKHIEDSEESKEENETNEKNQLTQQEEQEDQEIIHERIEMIGGTDEVDLVCMSLFQTPHMRAAIGTKCGCEKEMEGLKKERDEAVKMLAEITRSNKFACQQLKELQEQNDKLTAEQERLHGHIGSLPHKEVGHTEGHQGETGNQIVSDNPRKSEHKRKRETVDSFSDHLETQFSRVMERAEEVQASLSLEFPSFIRLIVQSQVTQGFWLGLPLKFCKLHLPSHNETVVLEDESGEEYNTNFLVGKCGLSGGWKGFSVAHKLLEGDAVVFQLVKRCKFKVYIVRASNLSVVNRAATDQWESDEENLYSSDKEGLKLSGSIPGFENFNIIVNGITIDSKFSKHIQTKYHNLCSSRKSYLHEHLPKNIDCTLAVGIINETISISDAIRACKLSSLGDYLTIWDKSLKAFEQLGMDVGFLRARLNRLVNLAMELTQAPESKRYEEARIERERAEEEKASLESKLVELKEAKSRLDDEIDTLEEYARKCEIMFQEEASAPW